MTDDSFSDIHNTHKDSPVASLSRSELVASVAGRVKSLTFEDVKSVLDALTSLYRLSTRNHLTPANLSNSIYAAILGEGGNLVAEERSTTFKSRLTDLLSLESLVALKARELQTDVERSLCEARILTDLRPIFGNDVPNALTSMIIVHTLKLVYHTGPTGEHEEIYIAVDSDDIARLKEMLNRAEGKARTLASKLKASGIESVDLP
jgi:hypothetical protein